MKLNLKFQDFLTLFLIFISINLTIYYDWWKSFNSFIKYLDIWIFLFAFFLALFCKKIFHIVLIIIFTFVIVNYDGFSSLISNIFLFSLSLCIGIYIYFTFELKKDEFFIFKSIAIGLGVISFIINLFSFFKINTVPFYTCFFILLFFFILYKKNFFIFNEFKNIFISFKNIHEISRFNIFFICLITIYILFVSIIPESSHDGLSTHLAVPKMVKYLNFWHYDFENYVWGVQPFGAQWIFTFLYFFGGELAVKLFNPIILILITIVIYKNLLIFCQKKNLLIFLSLVIASLPITFTLIQSLHVEIFQSFIIILIFTFLLKPKEQICWKSISILSGFSLSIKSSTILIIPILVFEYFRLQKPDLKKLFLNLLLVIIFGSLPYIVAFIKTGSPTFPLYNEIFKSDYIAKSAFYHPIWANESIQDFLKSTFESKNYGSFDSNGAISIFFPIFFFLILINFKKFIKSDFKYFFYFLSVIVSIIIMFTFQTLLRYIYFLIPTLFLLMSILILKINLNKKTLNLLALSILLIAVLKYDKTSTQLPNEINIFFDHKKMISYDKVRQPMKYLGIQLNNNKKYKDKKIFILSRGNIPKYASFNMKVAFWSWHSLKFYIQLINNNNLEKTLKQLNYDYLIYEANYDLKETIRIFKDNPKNIGIFEENILGFEIRKV